MKKFFGALTGALLLIGLAGCGDGNGFRAAEKAADAGNWKMAMAIAEKAAKESPRDIKGQLLLAVTAEKCNQRQIALDAATRAVKLNEKDFTAQYTLGRLCAADPAKRVEGLKHLIAAHQLNPGAVEALVAICNTMQMMRHPQTVSYLLKLQKIAGYNGNAVYCNDLAVAYALEGRSGAAKTFFINAYKLDPKNPDLLLNMARFFETTRWRNLAVNYYFFFLQQAGNRPEYRGEVAAVKQHLNLK